MMQEQVAKKAMSKVKEGMTQQQMEKMQRREGQFVVEMWSLW